MFDNDEGSAQIGFWCGLISLLGLVPIKYVGLLSIPGLVFSIFGRKSKKRKFAIAGIILSSIMLAIIILALTFYYGGFA